MERGGVLATTQFAYLKSLGTCDAHLCMFLTLQSAFESGQESMIVQIDLSAAFDRVNHQNILYSFCVVYTDRVSVKPITAGLCWMVVEVNWFTLGQ